MLLAFGGQGPGIRNVTQGAIYKTKSLPMILTGIRLRNCLATKPCFEAASLQVLTRCPQESSLFPFLENSVTRVATLEDSYCLFR